MSQVEDVPRPSRSLRQHLLDAHLQNRLRRKQRNRIQIALHRAAIPHRPPPLIQRSPPVEPNHIRARLPHRRQQTRRLDTKVDHRHAHLLHRAHQPRSHRQNVVAIILNRQRTHPAVKNLDHIRARIHLLLGIHRQHRHQLVQQLLPRIRLGVHHLLGKDIIPRTAALDHVTRQRKRSPAEPNHPHRIAKVPSHLLNRRRHVLQLPGPVHAQLVNSFGAAQRRVHQRPLAGHKLKIQPHRLQRQQQIGKDDRGVHAQLLRSSNRHLRSQIRTLADLHQGVMFAHLAILRHIPPSLAQEPDRRPVNRLLETSPQKPAPTRKSKRLARILNQRAHILRF